MNETYKYTMKTTFLGKPHQEECVISKDVFYPYGEVSVGLKTRGEFGFIKVLKVYEEPHFKYGKFIAESINYEDMLKVETC